MTVYVDVKPGHWVLSFHQPYGPYDRTLPELLEGYAFRHWMDNRNVDEVFFVLQAQKVMPNTFIANGASRYISEGDRLPRSHVIATCNSEAAALALRDKFFAIGEETGDRIEKEMHRRIENFADREQAKAMKKIHRCLPHIFGRVA